MIVYVKDGQDISVIAELGPSVYDPAGIKTGVAQTFRVIANSFGPNLKLVPLVDKVTILTGELRRNV